MTIREEDAMMMMMMDTSDVYGTYQIVDGERHDDSGHQKIGERQTDYEIVGDRTKTLLTKDCHDDEAVAEHGAERKQNEHDCPVKLFRCGRRRRR